MPIDYDALAAEHGGTSQDQGPGAGDLLGAAAGPNLGGMAGAAGLAGVGAAGVGLAKLGSAGRNALGGVAGKFLARRIPGVGMAMDAADVVRDLRGAAPVDASSTSAPSMAAPPPAPISGKPSKVITLTEQDIATHPEFKRFPVGYEMSRTKYENTLMKPGPESRIAKLEEIRGGNNPKAPYPSEPAGTLHDFNSSQPIRKPAATKESPGAGQDISRPEVARRQAGLARARAARKGISLKEALAEIESDLASRSGSRMIGGLGPMDVVSLMSEVDPQGYAQFEQQAMHPAQAINGGASQGIELLKQLIGQYKPMPPIDINSPEFQRLRNQFNR